MRKRRTDRQRPDQDAERRAAPPFEPARGDLHPRRIDPGERRAGRHAKRDQLDGPVCRHESGVRQRRQDAAEIEQPARIQTSGRFSKADTSVPRTNPA